MLWDDATGNLTKFNEYGEKSFLSCMPKDTKNNGYFFEFYYVCVIVVQQTQVYAHAQILLSLHSHTSF